MRSGLIIRRRLLHSLRSNIVSSSRERQVYPLNSTTSTASQFVVEGSVPLYMHFAVAHRAIH